MPIVDWLEEDNFAQHGKTPVKPGNEHGTYIPVDGRDCLNVASSRVPDKHDI